MTSNSTVAPSAQQECARLQQRPHLTLPRRAADRVARRRTLALSNRRSSTCPSAGPSKNLGVDDSGEELDYVEQITKKPVLNGVQAPRPEHPTDNRGRCSTDQVLAEAADVDARRLMAGAAIEGQAAV